MAAAGVAPRPRRWFAVSLLPLTILILQDQHRFQPWVYQYACTGLLLTGLRRGRGTGLRYARWWMVSLYLHSGLSKLDRSFVDELGNVFLATGLRVLQRPPDFVPERWRVAAILAMPLYEVAAAVALLIPTTRRLGLLGVSAIHLALIADPRAVRPGSAA